MRKKKTPPISNFFKPIASNSTVENANATVEVDVTEQPTDHNIPNHSSVDMPPPEQNIEASVEVEVLEQQRIGSTPLSETLESANRFGNSLLISKMKHANSIFLKADTCHT